jgi:hypothetical protein
MPKRTRLNIWQIASALNPDREKGKSFYPKRKINQKNSVRRDDRGSKKRGGRVAGFDMLGPSKPDGPPHEDLFPYGSGEINGECAHGQLLYELCRRGEDETGNTLLAEGEIPRVPHPLQ